MSNCLKPHTVYIRYLSIKSYTTVVVYKKNNCQTWSKVEQRCKMYLNCYLLILSVPKPFCKLSRNTSFECVSLDYAMRLQRNIFLVAIFHLQLSSVVVISTTSGRYDGVLIESTDFCLSSMFHFFL